MVTRFLAPQFLILYWFAITALLVHFRGRERFGFARQLTDHSTLLAPYNVLMYWFSAVPSRPVLPVASIPDLTKLRDNWQMIRDEALALNQDGRIKAADKYNDFGFNSFFRTGWKRFYLKWYDEPLPSAKALCPKTVALLDSIPGIKGAMFASLGPNSQLVRHRDPYAGSLRYHLGLVTPKSPGECRIFVDGKPYTWHDGEDLLFDETYIHYAENTTSDTRIILFCERRAAAAYAHRDLDQPLGLRSRGAAEQDAERRWRAGRRPEQDLPSSLSGAARRQAHEGLEFEGSIMR